MSWCEVSVVVFVVMLLWGVWLWIQQQALQKLINETDERIKAQIRLMEDDV